MHFGVEIVPFGEYSDPRNVLQLALEAEKAGWEGLWVWDHLNFPYGQSDPWVNLAAVAAKTKRLKLVNGVAPLPRYHPHVLARLTASLDNLSQGRLIFAAGLGVDEDALPSGVPGDPKVRAEMLDEGLDLITRLWTGERVTSHGKYYTFQDAICIPSPRQKPRPPIWIGGESQAAIKRAAHWDGWIAGTINEKQEVIQTPEQLAQQIARIRLVQENLHAFDVAIQGASQPSQVSLIREYEHAGATWWFESLFPLRGSMSEMLQRIKAGLPY